MSKTAGRRICRSQEEWQRLIDERTGSVQTQTTFCAERGISVASVQNGKRRLDVSETMSESTPGCWIELGTLAAAKSVSWDVELELGGGECLYLRRC